MKFKMDRIKRLFQVFVIIIPCMFTAENHALTAYIQQACYGNGFEDYLIPTCRTGEKIYVYDVFVYAKRKELNCPQIATYFDRNITYCCNYVNEKEDCGQRYFGTSSDFEHVHYSRCTGMTTCSGIPVAWNYTEHFCDISVFADRTNYMKMWFNCIPDISSMSINSMSMLTDNPVFLFSENYPATMSECSVTSGATCALQTTNESPIQITLLDLQLSDATGICNQRLYITDGLSNTEISCQDNNHFQKKKVYISINGRIEIRLDNTATTSAGKFWIQIEAAETAGSVSVECRAAAAVFKCGSSLTMLQSEVSTLTEYAASKELVTTSTEFYWSTSYESGIEQTNTLAGSEFRETLKTTIPTDTERSSIQVESRDDWDSHKYIKTSSEVFTLSKDLITLSSEVRKMTETYFDIQKSSIFLESSDKLDPRLTVDFTRSSEAVTLDKNMVTSSSDIKKTTDILPDIQKSSLYLESSDKQLLDPRLSEYIRTSSLLKDMITSSSEKWKFTETFSDFQKSPLYLESSYEFDTQFSKYLKTSFLSKDMITSLSEVGKTSEMITDIQKSSLYLESSNKLNPSVSEYLKTSNIFKDMITSSSKVEKLTETFSDVQRSSISVKSSDTLAPSISEYFTAVSLSKDMVTTSSEVRHMTQTFSEIYKSSLYLESSDKLNPRLSEYLRSSSVVSTMDKDMVTSLSDIKKTSDMIADLQKSSLYFQSGDKLNTQVSEYFKTSSTSLSHVASSSIYRTLSDSLYTSPTETSSTSISDTGVKHSQTDFSLSMSSFERSTVIESTQEFTSTSFLSDSPAASIDTFLHSIFTDFSSAHNFLSTSVTEKTKTIDFTTSKALYQYSSSFASITISRSQISSSLETSSTPATTFSRLPIATSSTLFDTGTITSTRHHSSSLTTAKTSSLDKQAMSTSTATPTSGSAIDTSVVSGPSSVTESISTSSNTLSFTATTPRSSLLSPSASTSEDISFTLPTPFSDSSHTVRATQVISSDSVSPRADSYVSTSAPTPSTDSIQVSTTISSSNIIASSTPFSAIITSTGLLLISTTLSSSSNETSMTPTLSSAVVSTASASSGLTLTPTTSSTSNSSTSEQDPASSDDSLDLSWVFTIFPATIGTATVMGAIMYALNRCKKKCTHVNDETPRRRIAFA